MMRIALSLALDPRRKREQENVEQHLVPLARPAAQLVPRSTALPPRRALARPPQLDEQLGTLGSPIVRVVLERERATRRQDARAPSVRPRDAPPGRHLERRPRAPAPDPSPAACSSLLLIVAESSRCRPANPQRRYAAAVGPSARMRPCAMPGDGPQVEDERREVCRDREGCEPLTGGGCGCDGARQKEEREQGQCASGDEGEKGRERTDETVAALVRDGSCVAAAQRREGPEAEAADGRDGEENALEEGALAQVVAVGAVARGDEGQRACFEGCTRGRR